jgi:hypothetical protein
MIMGTPRWIARFGFTAIVTLCYYKSSLINIPINSPIMILVGICIICYVIDDICRIIGLTR